MRSRVAQVRLWTQDQQYVFFLFEIYTLMGQDGFLRILHRRELAVFRIQFSCSCHLVFLLQNCIAIAILE
jgi:hypothetical protein